MYSYSDHVAVMAAKAAINSSTRLGGWQRHCRGDYCLSRVVLSACVCVGDRLQVELARKRIVPQLNAIYALVYVDCDKHFLEMAAGCFWLVGVPRFCGFDRALVLFERDFLRRDPRQWGAVQRVWVSYREHT
jgi:hypothetical protein